MSPIKRKAAVLLGTAAMFGAAGCGATTSGSSDSTAAAPATQASAQTAGAPPAMTGQAGTAAQGTQGPGGGQVGGPGGGPPDVSSLATALGVSTTKLQAAMDATRPQPGTTGTAPPSASTMAADLAQELNLDEDKVAEALKSFMPQGGPPPNSTGPQGTDPQAAQAPSQAQETTSGGTT